MQTCLGNKPVPQDDGIGAEEHFIRGDRILHQNSPEDSRAYRHQGISSIEPEHGSTQVDHAKECCAVFSSLSTTEGFAARGSAAIGMRANAPSAATQVTSVPRVGFRRGPRRLCFWNGSGMLRSHVTVVGCPVEETAWMP